MDISNSKNYMAIHNETWWWCIFLQQYRIHMDIRNSKNYLGISVIITFTWNIMKLKDIWGDITDIFGQNNIFGLSVSCFLHTAAAANKLHK